MFGDKTPPPSPPHWIVAAIPPPPYLADYLGLFIAQGYMNNESPTAIYSFSFPFSGFFLYLTLMLEFALNIWILTHILSLRYISQKYYVWGEGRGGANDVFYE